MIKKILALFLFWRLALFIIAYLAVIFIQTFAGTFPYYDLVLQPTNLPEWVWGFGNFDGVHYLRIAQNGYNAEFSQAFFPLFPLLIRIFNFIPKNPTLHIETFVDPSFFFTGIILSNIIFLLVLIMFYKLIRIDFDKKIAYGSLVLLVAFPTSFYFGSIYTESLFLLFVIGTFYFVRKGNFLVAGILSAFASATRIFGLLLIPVLLIEIYLKIKNGDIKLDSTETIKATIGVLLAPFGTLFYMLYLRLNFDNPLYFLTSQSAFGGERTPANLIFLPQVIYRYLKIFITVPKASPLFLNAFSEFIFTITAIGCLLFFMRKMRFSYLIFTLGCLILPTLTGTLSSMPRYSLMGFLILPYISQVTRRFYIALVSLFIVIGIILTGLFIRGYWVA